MAGKSMYRRGFVLLRRRWATVGFAVGWFTIFGMSAAPQIAYGADEVPCWNLDLGAGGAEICALVEEAKDLLSRLKPSTADHLEKVSEQFELERSLRVQQALFREDLTWLNRGYSSRQMDVMVFIAVALSIERAIVLTGELSSVYENHHDAKTKERLESVTLYQTQALSLLRGLTRQLQDVKDYELKFFF